MSYMRLATKIVKSLVEVLYLFIEESHKSGRHDGGLASVEWKKCSPLIEKIEWNSDEPFWEIHFNNICVAMDTCDTF